MIQFESGELRKKRVKEAITPDTKVKVLGVGGAGCSIISRIHSRSWNHISFVAVDSSVRKLESCTGIQKLQLGGSVTRGWGTGGDKELARRIAEEAEDEIRRILTGVDLLFIVCGLGKGLGTGASPVILKVARETGCLSIGFFILPFNFEGQEKVANSKETLEKLWQMVDGAVVISNDVLLSIENSNLDSLPASLSLIEAFKKIDEVFELLLRSVEDILYTPGIISLDFTDIKSFLDRGKQIVIATGRGNGERCVEEAVEQVLYSPLWGEVPLKKTRGILLIIRSGENFKLRQLEKVVVSLKKQINSSVPINFGVYTKEELLDELLLTIMLSNTRSMELEIGEEKLYQKDFKLKVYDEQDLDVPTFLRKQHN